MEVWITVEAIAGLVNNCGVWLSGNVSALCECQAGGHFIQSIHMITLIRQIILHSGANGINRSKGGSLCGSSCVINNTAVPC